MKFKNSLITDQSTSISNTIGRFNGTKISSTEGTTNSNITNIFLSKLKNKGNLEECISEKEKKPTLACPFLSNLDLNGKESKAESRQIYFLSKLFNTENDFGKDRVSNDFLSKMKNQTNTIQLDNSSSSISEDFKTGASLSQFEKGEGNKSSLTINISNSISEKTTLSSNGLKKSANEKLNIFLSKMNTKQSPTALGKTNSDISLASKKSPSLSTEFSKLKLTDVKSMPSIGDKAEFNINLMTALQRNKENFKFKPLSNKEKFSLPAVGDEEKFEIPFVDENEMEEEARILECTMDLSHLARMNVLYYRKKPSPLGRMMCVRYKLSKVQTIRKKKIKLNPKLVYFNFLEPSPDDKISKHIKRNFQ